PAPSGRSAATAKHVRHEAASTTAANAIGAIVPAIESDVCWNPRAVPLRARPANSAVAVKARPFQAIVNAAETTNEGRSTTSGADTRAAETATAAAIANPSSRSGHTRARARSDQRPSPIRKPIAAVWAAASLAVAA